MLSAMRNVSRLTMRSVARLAIRTLSASPPKDFIKYDPSNVRTVFENQQTYSIVSNALLYQVLSNVPLVDYGKKVAKQILFQENSNQRYFTKVPWVLRFSTKHFLMWTVLTNFYSGDWFEDCVDLCEIWYNRDGVTGICDFSYDEESTDPGRFQEYMDNIIRDHSILDNEVANGGIRFSALKATALIDPGVLERLTIILQNNNFDNSNTSNTHSSRNTRNTNDTQDKVASDYINLLSEGDKKEYLNGIARLARVIRFSSSYRVALLLDAEKTNMQPAVELIAQEMSQKYNKVGQPIAIYNTYQMYLRRSPSALKRDMMRAEEKGYLFACKIVRGAYMLSERETAQSNSVDDPVLSTREETDLAFNTAVTDVLNKISKSSVASSAPLPTPSIMIATHNRVSLQLAVDNMQRLRMSNDDKHVHFAQILGIVDNLTISLAKSGYY